MNKWFLLTLIGISLEVSASVLPAGSLCQDFKGREIEITGFENGKYLVKRFDHSFNFLGKGKAWPESLKNCEALESLEDVKHRVLDKIMTIGGQSLLDANFGDQDSQGRKSAAVNEPISN